MRNNSNKYNNITKTNEVLNAYINKFWDDVFEPLIQDGSIKHLMILCKVKYSEDDNELGYRTLAPLRRVDYSDKDLFIGYLQERLGILIDSYNTNTVSEIILTYIIKEGEVSSEDRLLLQDLSNKE